MAFSKSSSEIMSKPMNCEKKGTCYDCKCHKLIIKLCGRKVAFPTPSFFILPSSQSFLRVCSTEPLLISGHSSAMSVLVNFPILEFTAFSTISLADIFFSTMLTLSSKSRYAASMVPRRYLMKGESLLLSPILAV